MVFSIHDNKYNTDTGFFLAQPQALHSCHYESDVGPCLVVLLTCYLFGSQVRKLLANCLLTAC